MANRLYPTSANTAYTAHFVRLNFGFAETSYMLETLCTIMEEERLIAKRKAISFQKKGCAWYIKVKYKE